MHSRGTEGEDTVCLGDLGLGLDIPKDRVLVELSIVRRPSSLCHVEEVTYLTVEAVDLTREKLVGLLSVWVGKEVVLDLLGLSGHLGGVSLHLGVEGVSQRE